MWEEDVLPRALQNHLLQDRHLTTLAGLCMPQYLPELAVLMPKFWILTRKHVEVILSLALLVLQPVAVLAQHL